MALLGTRLLLRCRQEGLLVVLALVEGDHSDLCVGVEGVKRPSFWQLSLLAEQRMLFLILLSIEFQQVDPWSLRPLISYPNRRPSLIRDTWLVARHELLGDAN